MMYDYIKGNLVHISCEHATIESNGIGYKILIPINFYTNAQKLGEEVCLYTSFVVREDSQKLFGFSSRGERDFFEKLIGISGIGAKIALSLIGHMESAQLQMAIQTGNASMLSRIPGIGKKTAKRIIMELGDRIHKWKLDTSNKINGPPEMIHDALIALINLGYNQAQAQKALQRTLDEKGDKIELSSLISHALQRV